MPTVTAQNAGQQHVGVFGEFSPYEDRNKAESLYDTGRATWIHNIEGECKK